VDLEPEPLDVCLLENRSMRCACRTISRVLTASVTASIGDRLWQSLDAWARHLAVQCVVSPGGGASARSRTRLTALGRERRLAGLPRLIAQQMRRGRRG